MAELDAWASGKIDDTTNRALKLQSQYETIEKNMMGHVQAVIAKLTGSEIFDPECDALLAEVEGMFSCLHVGDSGTEPTMDATSNALSKVQALPDGLEKSAITAVLEASMVSQQVGERKYNNMLIYYFDHIKLRNQSLTGTHTPTPCF